MTTVPQQSTWFVMSVEPAPIDENEGWASCLNCREVFRHEHHCPKPTPSEILDKLFEERIPAVLEKLFTQGGWTSCLHCRSVFYGGEHNCHGPLPPQSVRTTKRIPIGSFDNAGRCHTPYYGARLGYGCWALFGSTDRHIRDHRHRQHSDDYLYLRSADSAKYETDEEASYWHSWRLHNMFVAKAPELARATFLKVITQDGISPCVPGKCYPDNHRRYRVMGVAERGDKELVIDLGFWIGGPGFRHWALENACNDTARAIIQRWPGVQAGFAWDEVKK